MSRRTRIVNLAALAAVAACAPAASAATVSLDSTGALHYEAAPGEVNRPLVRHDPCGPDTFCSQFSISEQEGSTAQLTVTAPCYSTATSVSCPEAPRKVYVVLGDKDDSATVRYPGRVFGGAGHDRIESADASIAGDDGNDVLLGTGHVVSGGPGNDVLQPHDPFSTAATTFLGGSGHDRITGGAGPDRLSGGDGKDRLDARDGVADVLLDCGAHADVLTRDLVDPAGTACESTG